MKIDIHTHLIPPEAFGKDAPNFSPKLFQDKQGREFLKIGKEKLRVSEQFYNPERRLRDMDETEVDIQVLLPGPSLYFYRLDHNLASKFAKIQNDGIAKIVRKFPDRFVGFATVPLQDPNDAVIELRRVVNDLGMKGVEIGTNIRGQNLDVHGLWPFYEEVQQLDVPIVVHPIKVAAIRRLRKYHLKNLIGNPLDTSIAIASIIFGGVLEEFPNLRFCFLHGGGFVPYQRGRLEHGYKVRREPKVNIPKPPSEYLKQLFFDTITHYAPALKFLIETVGSDKVLMGSDYPADMGDPNPVVTVKNLQFLDNEAKQKILGANAANLLKLDY